MDQLKSRIRTAREAEGLTQEELADVIGISKTQVYNWERGTHSPSSSILGKLAKALGTSQSYLLGETEDPSPPRQFNVQLATTTPQIADRPDVPMRSQGYDAAAILERLDAIESATVEHFAAYKLNTEIIKNFMQAHDAELKQEIMAHEKASTDRILEAVNAIVGSLFNLMKDAHSTERMGNVLKLIHGEQTKVVDNATKVAEEESKELRIIPRKIPTLPYIRTRIPRWTKNEAKVLIPAGGAGGVGMDYLEDLWKRRRPNRLDTVTGITPEPCPFCLRVIGHSMESLIVNGAQAYYRFCTWKDIRNGDIVLLFDQGAGDKGEMKIRKAECRGDGRCVFVALNPDYPERLELGDQIVVRGIVLYADNEIGEGYNPEEVVRDQRERERERETEEGVTE